MQHWLVKSEPEAYSWDAFLRDKKTDWTGVRNFAARNHLRAMRKGDTVFFYESVTTKAVVGIAEVTREAFPDSTADEGDWSAVELKAVRSLSAPVTLDQIKAEKSLARERLQTERNRGKKRGTKGRMIPRKLSDRSWGSLKKLTLR